MSSFYNKYKGLFEDEGVNKPLPVNYEKPVPKYELELCKDWFSNAPMPKQRVFVQGRDANCSPLKAEALNSLLDSSFKPLLFPVKEESEIRKGTLSNLYKNSLMHQAPALKLYYEDSAYKKAEPTVSLRMKKQCQVLESKPVTIAKYRSEYVFPTASNQEIFHSIETYKPVKHVKEIDDIGSMPERSIASNIKANDEYKVMRLSLIHICRCRRYAVCRSRWSPYH
eukprot:TRINITY_DN7527_c0_g1_i5.p1 TRINITY_DN7527_c0_g1~~TRINITY_DN7527_c0_g1_i5.p1  ORF type:complete len:225 (+),score=35.52 TRINITY_DN7527_c0_g1_i5:158-832(+)